jgi:hypothetical protein
MPRVTHTVGRLGGSGLFRGFGYPNSKPNVRVFDSRGALVGCLGAWLVCSGRLVGWVFGWVATVGVVILQVLPCCQPRGKSCAGGCPAADEPHLRVLYGMLPQLLGREYTHDPGT